MYMSQGKLKYQPPLGQTKTTFHLGDKVWVQVRVRVEPGLSSPKPSHPHPQEDFIEIEMCEVIRRSGIHLKRIKTLIDIEYFICKLYFCQSSVSRESPNLSRERIERTHQIACSHSFEMKFGHVKNIYISDFFIYLSSTYIVKDTACTFIHSTMHTLVPIILMCLLQIGSGEVS